MEIFKYVNGFVVYRISDVLNTLKMELNSLNAIKSFVMMEFIGNDKLLESEICKCRSICQCQLQNLSIFVFRNKPILHFIHRCQFIFYIVCAYTNFFTVYTAWALVFFNLHPFFCTDNKNFLRFRKFKIRIIFLTTAWM